MLTPRGFEIRGNSRRPARLRRRRRLRLVLLVLVVAALAVAAWFAYDRWLAEPEAASGPVLPAARATASPTPTASTCSAPAPRSIRVTVFNSTPRPGLAATVSTALRSRGFTVAKVANARTRTPVAASAQIRASRAQTARANVVAAHFEGARVVLDARSGTGVDVVLGTGFRGLRATPAAVC